MLNKVKNYITENHFLKNVLTITSGTVMAQAINMLFSPIITRIYSPAEYGVYTVFMSILMIFSFSSLKYEIALPIAKEGKEAINLLVLSILILFGTTFTIVILLLTFGNEILSFLNMNAIIDYKYFIPIGVFFYGIYVIFVQWSYRSKNFKIISTTKMYQTLLGNITKFVLGLLRFGPSGLLLGTIMNESVGFSSIFRLFLRKDKFLLKMVNFNNLKMVAKKYINFPKYQAPSALSLHIRNQLPIFFITPLFGSEIVGYYGLANTIVKIPMLLIGKSVMDIFYVEIASVGKEDAKYINNLINNLTKKLFIIGFFPFTLLFLFGPLLFSLVFGNEWYEAGIYARILSIYLFANLVFSPVSRVYEVFDKQNYKFMVDLISLVIVFLVFIISKIFLFSSYVTITLFSISMALLYLITYLLAKIIVRKNQ